VPCREPRDVDVVLEQGRHAPEGGTRVGARISEGALEERELDPAQRGVDAAGTLGNGRQHFRRADLATAQERRERDGVVVVEDVALERVDSGGVHGKRRVRGIDRGLIIAPPRERP
jgi:hypothetical protein